MYRPSLNTIPTDQSDVNQAVCTHTRTHEYTQIKSGQYPDPPNTLSEDCRLLLKQVHIYMYIYICHVYVVYIYTYVLCIYIHKYVMYIYIYAVYIYVLWRMKMYVEDEI